MLSIPLVYMLDVRQRAQWRFERQRNPHCQGQITHSPMACSAVAYPTCLAPFFSFSFAQLWT